MNLAQLHAWADALEADFDGKTKSGLWMTLLTWKIGKEPYWALGYGKTAVLARDNARKTALATRLQLC